MPEFGFFGIADGARPLANYLGRYETWERQMVMQSGKVGEAGQKPRLPWAPGAERALSDAQLLRRYADARCQGLEAEAAFRELLDRHGPMVMAVCRQILRQDHDADDAFQATFLVLVRKARSIRVDESLAPWLCSVAFRTAQRARYVASRYRPMDAMQIEEHSGPPRDDAFQFDVRPLLHEELDRLPVKFREAIVLCHLEGKSHEEAARLLHWPVGTVSSRLSRGRRLLRSRLDAVASVFLPRSSQRAGWSSQRRSGSRCLNPRSTPPSGRRRRAMFQPLSNR